MRLYETTFIINPQTDDATIDRQVQDVADVVTTGGGKVVRENRMGTRRLAYMIEGLSQGYYANLIFEAPPTVVSDLERHFRLGESYLRFLTVLFEGTLQDDEEEDSRPAGRPAAKPSERPAPSGDGPHGRREDKPAAAPASEKPAEEAPKAEESEETGDASEEAAKDESDKAEEEKPKPAPEKSEESDKSDDSEKAEEADEDAKKAGEGPAESESYDEENQL